MKHYFVILVFCIILLSCTKQTENLHHCQTVIELSDKYRQSDSVYLRTDTVEWSPGEKQRTLCDSTLNAFKQAADTLRNEFKLCSLGLLEKIHFIYKP